MARKDLPTGNSTKYKKMRRTNKAMGRHQKVDRVFTGRDSTEGKTQRGMEEDSGRQIMGVAPTAQQTIG